jgi:hypothetical protein
MHRRQGGRPGSSAEASPILRLRVRGGGALREMPVHEVLPDAPQGKVRPRQGVRDSPPPPRLQGGGEEEPPVAGGDRDEGQPEHPGRGDVRDDQAGPRVRQVQEEGARRSRDGDDADLPRRQRAEILQVPEDGEAPRILEGAGRARGRVSPQADLRRETRREKRKRKLGCGNLDRKKGVRRAFSSRRTPFLFPSLSVPSPSPFSLLR